MAHEHQDAETASAAHAARALLEAELGDVAAAGASAALGLVIAERAGNAVHAIACAVPAAMADAAGGRTDVALASAERTLVAIRDRRIGLYYEPLLLGTMARCRLAHGDAAGALDAAEEAVAVAGTRGLTTCALSAPLTLAHVLLTLQGAGAQPRVEVLLGGAARIARTSGAHLFEPRIHLGRSALALACGDEDRALREEAQADRLAAAMSAPASLAPLARVRA
jgi:adenylate cyclase